MSTQKEQIVLFSRRFEAAIKLNGLTKKDLAKALNIAPQSFTRYKNERLPGTDILYKISHELGVSMNWLLGDGDINKPVYLSDNSEITRLQTKLDGAASALHGILREIEAK